MSWPSSCLILQAGSACAVQPKWSCAARCPARVEASKLSQQWKHVNCVGCSLMGSSLSLLKIVRHCPQCICQCPETRSAQPGVLRSDGHEVFFAAPLLRRVNGDDL